MAFRRDISRYVAANSSSAAGRGATRDAGLLEQARRALRGVAAAEWLVKRDPMLVGADDGPVKIRLRPLLQACLRERQN